MTLKTKCGVGIAAIAVVVMLLATPAVDAVFHGYYQTSQVVQWVLPIIVAVISFLLLWDLFNALIAGAVSFAMTMFMLGIMGIGALDCGSGDVPLSHSSVDPP